MAAIARQENLEAWQWVQKRFEKLGGHRKQAGGLNIWTCEVTGPRKSRRCMAICCRSPMHYSVKCRLIIPPTRRQRHSKRRKPRR